MKNYDELVQKVQTGEISMLDFVLSQDELTVLYVADMRAKGVTPTAENAEEWLSAYENNHLYQ